MGAKLKWTGLAAVVIGLPLMYRGGHNINESNLLAEKYAVSRNLGNEHGMREAFGPPVDVNPSLFMRGAGQAIGGSFLALAGAWTYALNPGPLLTVYRRRIRDPDESIFDEEPRRRGEPRVYNLDKERVTSHK